MAPLLPCHHCADCRLGRFSQCPNYSFIGSRANGGLAEYLAAKGDRLEYETSIAYGDSYGDLAMLRLCGQRVAVNPKRRLWHALHHDEGSRRVHWREPGKPAPASAR